MNQWEFMDKEYIWHPFTQMKGWNENKQLVIDHGEGVKLYDVEGNGIQVAPHPQQIISMPMSQSVVEYAMLRRKVD